jgi:hypothetical protein
MPLVGDSIIKNSYWLLELNWWILIDDAPFFATRTLAYKVTNKYIEIIFSRIHK